MNTQLSTKFAALVMALMMNSLMFGGIAYLFNTQVQDAQAPSISLAA